MWHVKMYASQLLYLYSENRNLYSTIESFYSAFSGNTCYLSMNYSCPLSIIGQPLATLELGVCLCKLNEEV